MEFNRESTALATALTTARFSSSIPLIYIYIYTSEYIYTYNDDGLMEDERGAVWGGGSRSYTSQPTKQLHGFFRPKP